MLIYDTSGSGHQSLRGLSSGIPSQQPIPQTRSTSNRLPLSTKMGTSTTPLHVFYSADVQYRQVSDMYVIKQEIRLHGHSVEDQWVVEV